MKRKYKVEMQVPVVLKYVVERNVDVLDVNDWSPEEIVEFDEEFVNEWIDAIDDKECRLLLHNPDMFAVEEIEDSRTIQLKIKGRKRNKKGPLGRYLRELTNYWLA